MRKLPSELERIRNEKCTLCPLHQDAEHVCLMGDGSLKADLFLVGEAPGEREDYIHKPFQGRAGKLLDSILFAFDLRRQSIYISNAVKCRPLGNKKPSDKNIETCSLKYLRSELQVVRPKLVVALGAVASQALLGHKVGVQAARNKIYYTRKEFGKTPVVVTYHPAAALRNDYLTERIVEDFETVMRYLKDGIQKKKEIKKEYKLVQTFRDIPGYPIFPVVTLDLETDGLNPYVKGRGILSVQIGTEVGKAYFAYWSHRIAKEVESIFRHSHVVVNHNIKFDLKWTKMEGLPLPKRVRDTMIEAHLLDENLMDKSLDVLATQFTDLKDHKDGVHEYKKKYKVEHKDVPQSIMIPYGCGDADAAFRLDKYFLPKIKENDLMPLLKLEMNALKMFVQVEHDGFKIDIPLIDELTDTYEAKLKKLEKDFNKQCKREINPRSPKQLMELMYGKWKLPPLGIKKPWIGKDGYDTTEDTLRRICGTFSIRREYRDAISTLIQIRETGTVLSRYLLGLSDFIDSDGFIHPSFRLDGTDTGRLSCRDPNFQQVPRQGDIKRLFISRYGRSGCIGQFDLSQAELRLGAHASNERKLLQLFRDGGADIHLSVAAQLLRKPESEVSAEERKRAKTVNFGIFYGAGAAKMAETEIEGKPLFRSKEEAAKFIHLWRANFPDWVIYEKKITKQVIETNEVRNIFGRIRHLLIIDPDNENGRRAIRQAINSPIQGGVADYTLHCGYQAYRRLRHLKRVHFVAQVHDAWIMDIHEDHVKEVVSVMKEEFENADLSRYGTELRVPMVIDASTGINWKEVKKYA